MSLFQEASSAELVRSSQKDEFFMQTIRSKLLDILSEIFGPYSTRYEHEIDLMAKLLYFVPTTLFSTSTLGEEYCSIKPISNGYPFKLCTPSILRRLLLSICAVGIPYCYNKIRKTGRSQHIRESWTDSKKNCYKIWNQLLSIIMKCDKFISFILKSHLCYFYFYGKAYELSKYMVGISYIYTGSPQNNNSRIISYSGLGRLLIIQFIISFTIIIFKIGKYIFHTLSNKKKRQYIISQITPTNMLKKSNFHLLFNRCYDEEDNQQIITMENIKKDKDKTVNNIDDDDDDNKTDNSSNGTNNDNKSNEDDEKSDDNTDKQSNDDGIDDMDDDDDDNDDGHDEVAILNELGLRYEDENENLDEDSNNRPECALCLSSRRFPTVTECGHIFCWNCIAEWCTTKPQCPLCKSHISHQKLIRLANLR